MADILQAAPRAATGARERFAVERITPLLGAEIREVNLARDLSEAEVAELRRLLLVHRLLVFRDQPITPAQQVALAKRFGPLEVHPYYGHHPDHPELVVLTSDASKPSRQNIWHSDVSWRETPSLGSILHCIECPEAGGDTMWADMVQAHARLPREIQQTIAGMHAVHDILFGSRLPPAKRREMRERFPPQDHPVVRTHPETGEKILFVNQAFTPCFSDYDEHVAHRVGRERRIGADTLLSMLVQQADIPEYQMRLRWRRGTVVFWDNRATQHYAIQDFFPAFRQMHRATIVGDRPV
jgi:taurine dioxygenase